MAAIFLLLIIGLLIFLLVSVLQNSERLREFRRKITNLEERIKTLEKKDYGRPAEPRLKENLNPQDEPKITLQPKTVIEEAKETKETKEPEVIEEIKEIKETSAKETVEIGKVAIEELEKTPITEIENKEELVPQETEVVSGFKPEVENIGYKYSRTVNTEPIPVPKKKSDFWAKTEKQFIENWTGILGAVIMVAGVVFFGIFAAVKVTAFYRFLLITGFAVLLTAAFIYLKRHDKWVKLALWLRSSAGAVFLFGCLGSAGIPGLQWITNPLEGIVVLNIGIVVNLLLGYFGGDQVYASLHVLLSLVALSIVPPTSVTLVMAALVSLFGIALTYREKWNYHLLLTVTSFFIYHLYWFYQQPVITFPYKILGIITVVSVSLSVAFVHYRNVYKNKVFDALPFLVHLINWFYFGTGLFLYSSGMKISTIFISIGAIAAFFLARKARKLEITWLYYTDTLVAQTTGIIALISLRNWDVRLSFILTSVFVEVLMYLFIMMKEKQDFLYKIGMILANVTGFVLITLSAANIISHHEATILYEYSGELFFCFLTGTVFAIYSAAKNKSFKELFVIFGIILAGILVAANVAVFLTYTKMSTLYLAVGTIIIFLLAQRVRKADVKWLSNIDMLLAQGSAMLTLVTLRNWEFDMVFILASITVEIMLFNIIVIREKEKVLYQIGGTLLYLISIALSAVALMQMDYGDTTILYRHAGEISGCLSLGILFVFYGYPKTKEFKDIFELYGLLIGVFFGMVYMHLYQIHWIEAGAAVSALLIIFIKEKSHLGELMYASLIILLSVFAVNWYYLISNYTKVNGEMMLLHGLPLFIVSAFCIKWSEYFGKLQNWIGIYLFAAHTVILTYLIFNPISSFIPGVLLLILSPVALELSHFARKRTSAAPPYKNQTDRFVLHVGYLFILLFLIRHVMVHLQSEQYLGSIIKIRFLIEILALPVFAFWASSKKPEGTKYASWEYLHPLFIELIIGFFALTVSVESTVFWYPIIWICSAFVMAFLGNWKKQTLSRLVFYSLVMYWVTAIQVAFVTSNYVTPSNHWYDQASYSGSISILLQFAFLIYFYLKCSLSDIIFPKPVKLFGELATGVQKSRNSWIFYPLILCTALFLYFSFDKSILTLLWVVECFMVFILSVILREKYFRYVALVGLGSCIIRLIFFDLAQTSTLTRAFVFIGVGIIMLVMNSIYNKYKGRFGNE